MKALKGLVVFMGLLIVGGLAVLGWGLSNQAGKVGKRPAAVAGDAFGAVEVAVPAGSKVEQALSVGDRVVLRLAGQGGERFVVLDPATGAVSGSFVLRPEAPAGKP